MTIGRLVGAIKDRLRADRPILVAIDGPVAVGKSALAQALAAGLRDVGVAGAVISADGFLLPLVRLSADGLVARKGFPESFDRPGMAAFLNGVLAGQTPDAPAYDHALYDINPSARQTTSGAPVVIFEGVNVLGPDLANLFDLSIYLDADDTDLERWFTRRFVETAFDAPRALALAPWRPVGGDLHAWAAAVWAGVNRPNVEQHIALGKARAEVLIRKDADHGLSLD